MANNLQYVYDRIASLSSFNPDLDSYDTEVRNEFNEVMVDFFGSKPYLFAVRTVDIPIIEEFSTTADIALGVDLLIDNLTDNSILSHPEYEGCILRLSGASDDDDNTDYIIDHISVAGIYVSRLPGDYRSGFHTNDTGITIKIYQRYVIMPQDCTQVIGVSRVEGDTVSTIANITRDQMEELNKGVPGDPACWAEYDWVDTILPVQPGDLTMTAASVAVGKGWPKGDYTFYLCYQKYGVYGPPSEGVSLTVGTDEVPSFQTINTTLNRDHGIRKRLLVRIDDVSGYEEEQLRDLGSYHDTTDPEITSFNYFLIDDSTATTVDWPSTLPYSLQWLKSLDRANEDDGVRKRVRLYPYAADDMRVRVWYMHRPRLLAEVTDIIPAPKDVVRYLIYRALSNLLQKHQEFQAATIWETKANNMLERLDARYLDQRGAYYVKGNLQVGSAFVHGRRVNISYNG